MHARGEEIVVHEPRHPLVRPHLGIQPSTAASHWSGAEVQKYRFLLRFRVLEHPLDIAAKVDFHGTSWRLL
jgi:hypothetical protein